MFDLSVPLTTTRDDSGRIQVQTAPLLFDQPWQAQVQPEPVWTRLEDEQLKTFKMLTMSGTWGGD